MNTKQELKDIITELDNLLPRVKKVLESTNKNAGDNDNTFTSQCLRNSSNEIGTAKTSLYYAMEEFDKWKK